MAKDPIKTLEMLEKKLDSKVSSILNDSAFRIQARVDSQEFIHWKSRRKPILVEKAKLVGNLMIAKVRGASGWKWGHVLIGPTGQTTIKARKQGGFLAIPTDFVQVNKGLLNKQGVGSGRYSGLITFAGVLWGKVGWGRGSFQQDVFKQRRAAAERFKKADLVPLFILKGSVIVKRRVIPA